MRAVSIIGTAQLPIKKQYELSLRQLGAAVVRQAMADAGVEAVEALYLGNMLSDELQGQKHLAALVADEAGLHGSEALQVRAATATGAAALRAAYLAIASDELDLVVAAGVEKMSQGEATPILAKALDAEQEIPGGATLVSQNARVMAHYLSHYGLPEDALVHFPVNAHNNAVHNLNALFNDRCITPPMVMTSRVIAAPIRLLDCAPICDGAAAVVLAPANIAGRYRSEPIRLLASTVATDRFRLADRENPLHLAAAERSGKQALAKAGLDLGDVDFFELHDAFSIMACLQLEALGFAAQGEGWRLAAEGKIRPDGKIPIATLGGLKARGHPIGATALYQVAEMVIQLTGQAGPVQVPDARVAMMQSIGGAASTVITHILARMD